MGIDSRDNSVSGKGFNGTYGIGGDILTLHIESIPWYVPWGLVESEIKKFLKPYLAEGGN